MLKDRVEMVVISALGLGMGLRDLKPESSFVDDLGADSLQMAEVIMRLEEKFEIEIPDEAAASLVTIQDVVNYIDSDGIILRDDGKKNNYLGERSIFVQS